MIYMTIIFIDITVTTNTKTNARRADKITQDSGFRLFGTCCSRNPGYLQILKMTIILRAFLAISLTCVSMCIVLI